MMACLKTAFRVLEADFRGESPVLMISNTLERSLSWDWIDFQSCLSPIGNPCGDVMRFMVSLEVAAIMHGLVSLEKKSEMDDGSVIEVLMHCASSGSSAKNLSTAQSLDLQVTSIRDAVSGITCWPVLADE